MTVVKGYTEAHGVDYTEVFAPVAKLDTPRMAITLVAQNFWPVFQFNVR